MKTAQKPKKTDAELFADAMKNVTPMTPHNLAERHAQTRPHATPKKTSSDFNQKAEARISDFIRPGIQRAVLRKLRNGQIPIEDELDLHGCTADEAEHRLRAFVYGAQRSGRQSAVRVIHGKGLGSPEGKPVLMYKVADCLRRFAAVLAFCPASLSDGGSGAVHVLLKRR